MVEPLTAEPVVTPVGHAEADATVGMRAGVLNRQLVLGLIVVGFVAAVGILAPLIAPANPLEATSAVLEPPSATHWFGTDRSGFDILSRTMYAPRVDLAIAGSATVLAMLAGVPLGLLAGYRQGFIAEALGRASDIVQAFPFFILAIVLLGIFGPSVRNLIAVVAFVNGPIYFRLMRGQTSALISRPYVEAARVVGCGDARIMLRHILPNSLAPILAQMSVTLGMAVILTAGVSFVGAGVRPPTPEWGVMISDGAPGMFTGQWWPALFPGLSLAITVMGFGLLANGITQAADPRSRRG